MQGVAKLARGAGNVGLLDVPESKVSAGHVLVEVTAAGSAQWRHLGAD